MDFKAIQEMIKTMDNSKLGYLEVNWHGIAIVMRKEGEAPQEKNSNIQEKESVISEISQDAIDIKKQIDVEKDIIEVEKDKKEEIKEDISDANIKEVVSPIVGTFYDSPAPDKPDFVKVGDKVKKGDTLCIIEAMKLMNEIQSEFDGEIVEILIEKEQMVEYGQSMFKIKID